MGTYLNPGSRRFQMAVNSEIYIDKTELIQYLNTIVNTNQRYVSVSCPRRFGKTITADMICAYYGDGDSSLLFKDMKLGKHDGWDQYRNQFDVVRLVMTDFFEKDVQVKKSLKKMQRLVSRDIKKRYPDVDYYDMDDLIQSMSDVYSEKGKQFVIVIDEWDAVFRTSKEDKERQTVYLDFLRKWLKDQEYIALAYMTGILPIKKYGEHSALNMFDEYSILQPMQLAPYTGFTEDEFKTSIRSEEWMDTFKASMTSQELFDRACQCIPGGVNSPVRAFGSVGMTPRFIRSASGDRIRDVEGKEYIDYVGSWGPMILGHGHPAVREAVERASRDGLSFGAATEREIEMAELICELVPSIEMVRMVNSGTEAVMSAIRTARGFTGRDKVIKFAGCYHGHMDAMLVQAGSGVMTQGIPGSAGVPVGCTQDTLTAPYNDLEWVEQLFESNDGEIAAVIVEPVGANMGVVLPEDGFLQGLHRICKEKGALLIFDEVITGFRLALDGAQGYYNVQPDLTTFGKIIGGGMPVGAYGGRREIMSLVAPSGPVYQAGTLSGNPVAMAAGLAQLRVLKETPHFYRILNEKAAFFFKRMKQILQEAQVPYCLNHVGSLGCIFFTDKVVKNDTDAKTSDTSRYQDYFRHMLDRGIYLAPSQFEVMFLSSAHTDEDLERTLEAVSAFVRI